MLNLVIRKQQAVRMLIRDEDYGPIIYVRNTELENFFFDLSVFMDEKNIKPIVPVDGRKDGSCSLLLSPEDAEKVQLWLRDSGAILHEE